MPRVTPSRNIGNFVPVNPVTPVISSYATTGGLVKVPVMDHNRHIITSHISKFPALSDTSKLYMYISSHYIHGHPNYIKQFVMSDLEQEIILSLMEHNLYCTPANSKLSIFVVDFAIGKQHNDRWHKENILEIMTLVQNHPAGNIIHFGMLYYTPNLVIPRSLIANIRLRCNNLPLFDSINRFIKDKLIHSCSRTIFGSVNKHVWMTKSLRTGSVRHGKALYSPIIALL